MADSFLTEAEGKALKLLAKNHRLLITLVPKNIPDGFMARLTVWQNFVLDTKLLPPLFVPAERSKTGDGLVCPYCGVPATVHLDLHLPTCEWQLGAHRYAGGMIGIDEEFGKADS